MNIRIINYLQLFRKNRFYLLLASDTLSNVGDWLSLIALMILCYNKTNSPLGVSSILIVRALPTLIFSFYAGVLADRMSRKKIMIITNLMRGIAVLALAFTYNIYILYSVSFLVASFGAFFSPSVEASVPELVGRENIVKANALFNLEKMITMIIGPAVAALCIKYLGINYTFLLDAVTFILFGIVILFVPIHRAKGICKDKIKFVFAEMGCGISYIKSNRLILYVLLSYGAAYCAMGALGTLELVFCSKILNVNTDAYGQIVAMAGAGAVLGTLFCGKMQKGKLLNLYVVGLILFGLGVLMFSLQTVFVATIPFLLVEGVGESFFSIGGRSYLQHNSPDEVMGKVMSHRNLMEKLGMLSGLFLSGVFAEYFSVEWVLMTFGVSLLLAGMISSIGFRIESLKACCTHEKNRSNASVTGCNASVLGG